MRQTVTFCSHKSLEGEHEQKIFSLAPFPLIIFHLFLRVNLLNISVKFTTARDFRVYEFLIFTTPAVKNTLRHGAFKAGTKG